MIQRLRIKNFRCFEEVELNDLRRFNVVVGQNGSGKTALLECLYLLFGVSPELYFRTRYWRGLGERVQLSTDRDQYDAVFHTLFYELDTQRLVEAELHDLPHGRRALRIFYEENHVLSLPLETQAVSSLGVKPIAFQWEGFSGKVHTSRVEFVEGRIRMSAFDEPYQGVFLTPGALLYPEDTGNRFSELSKQKKEGMVIDALQRLFPGVEGLSREVEGGTNVLYASVPYLPRKVPIGVLSAGISKLVAVLIAIAKLRGGVLLLDEMENGLYFGVMPDVWGAVLDLCRVNNTQLFVTTHSNECLRALLPEVTKHPDEFCLLRAERDQDRSIIEYVDGRAFEAALEQRVEVR